MPIASSNVEFWMQSLKDNADFFFDFAFDGYL
jgi:hypothetical protein